MSDIYEESADAVGVPAEIREELIAKVRKEVQSAAIPLIRERMHDAVMGGFVGTSVTSLVRVGAHPHLHEVLAKLILKH